MVAERHCAPARGRIVMDTKIKTFGGFEFNTHLLKPDDLPLVAEFWRHISRKNLDTRFMGEDDPTHPDFPAHPTNEHGETTSTFLATGGDGSVISIAILISDAAQGKARVMVFTRDGITFHGVSWALLSLVLDKARADGITSVSSVLNMADIDAIRLELKMGFVESDYPDNPDLRLLEWTWPAAGKQV